MAAQRVRRVVTGHDAQGRSIVVADEAAEMEGILHEFWLTGSTPARWGGKPELGQLPNNLEPPKNGTVVRFVEFQAYEGASREELEQRYAAAFKSIQASHTRVDTRRHPAMHKTRTVDYGIVLAGKIKLLMDEGAGTVLEPFAVVIQRGTNHGWVNPGPGPALMAFILIDAVE
jgi:mannose-6-phosphate isomerase-like protein (cupin superfamily)